jgi:hypothetical protein
VINYNSKDPIFDWKPSFPVNDALKMFCFLGRRTFKVVGEIYHDVPVRVAFTVVISICVSVYKSELDKNFATDV